MNTDQLTEEEQAAMAAMEAEAPVEVQDAEPTPAPEPEAAQPAPEPEAPEQPPKEEAAKAEAEAQRPPEGFVPHQAMHAERTRRQEAERELEALRQWRAKAEAAAKQAEEPMPDPVTEPERFAAWQSQRLSEQAKALEAVQNQQREAAQFARMQQEVMAAEAEFKVKAPDYDNAVQHMLNVRSQELGFLGVPPDRIGAVIAEEARTIVAQALRGGLNPAEVAYNMAKARGYTPPAPAPAPKPATPAPAEAVAAKAKAQEATATLGTAGGPVQGGALTAETIASMSDAEFAKLSDEQIAAAMGG